MPTLQLEPADPRELGGFRLVARLGEGGQGIVYLGLDGSGRQVAVKVLKTGADEKARERLAREMAAAQKVAPFCTARVLGASVQGPQPYVVSEYVEGPSLAERVRTGGPLREGELDRLVVGTATALTAIHGAGIIHRDLKPANVLLGPDGPRVVDFGIARAIDAGTMTGLVGTPAYFAPEQLADHPPTPALDVFAWAATMAFAATGKAPFGQDTIPAVLNRIAHYDPDLTGVPADLAAVLAECLAKDPARRPTARALLVRLVDPSAGVERHVTGPLAQAADQALHAPGTVTGPTRGDAYPQPTVQPTNTGYRQDAGATGQPPTGAAYVHEAGTYSQGGPTDPRGVHPGSAGPTVAGESRRGRAGLVLAGVAGGLVLALAVGSATWVLVSGSKHGTGSTGTTRTSSQAPVHSGGPGAAASKTSGGNSPVIPAEIAGTWNGEVVQKNNPLGDILRSKIRMTLSAGQRTAPAVYADWQNCTETYTLTAVSGSVYTFGEATSDDPVNCGTMGVVTLTKAGDTLKYHWGTGPSGEYSDAVLTKG